ncbi:ABC transporter [Thiocapsa imhoffii]|uniref:ABC transporter n=1 Tax=Thiocapsa imhoffii TaxID=382777 RepID=A0A9X1B8G8_9GAMM|nr:ABC transporter ATP-binding protein [Thiocapsa imhoffii]MBK1643956.1 ABC transporter [Thiocapsa imhoffii]
MHALEVEQLTKTYQGGFRALKGIDLTVAEGDFFALLGPNGAGKSTFIGILASLVNKTAGRVRVFGDDLDREPERVKSAIGLVPQEFNFNLFLPVEEVVLNQAGYYGIARREAKVRARRYLKQLDLWDRRDSEMRKLSGGMKRRLMIARALVHEPRLLILDEPTAGVDIEIRRSMWAFLRELNAGGTTIILTTHYLEEAESLCRNIAIINEGEVAESTSIVRLLDRLHTETFVLNLKGRVSELPQLGGFVLQHLDDCTLEVEMSREHTINGLFQALSRNGIEVISLRNKQNRLERLFLDMVDRGTQVAAPRPNSLTVPQPMISREDLA